MIVSSKITQDNPQIDGRRTVREVHTDDAGKEYIFDYMADKDADTQAKLEERALQLNADSEVQAANAEATAQAEVDSINAQIDVLTEMLPIAEAKVATIQEAKNLEINKTVLK